MVSKEAKISLALQEIREQWIKRQSDDHPESWGVDYKNKEKYSEYKVSAHLIQACIDNNMQIRPKELKTLVLSTAVETLKNIIIQTSEKEERSANDLARRELIKVKASKGLDKSEKIKENYYPLKDHRELENEHKRLEEENERKTQKKTELGETLSRNFEALTEGISELVSLKIDRKNKSREAEKRLKEREIIPVLLMQTTLRDTPSAFINTKKLEETLNLKVTKRKPRIKNPSSLKDSNVSLTDTVKKKEHIEKQDSSSMNLSPHFPNQSYNYTKKSFENIEYSNDNNTFSNNNLYTNNFDEKLSRLQETVEQSPEDVKYQSEENKAEANKRESEEEEIDEVYVEDFEDD